MTLAALHPPRAAVPRSWRRRMLPALVSSLLLPGSALAADAELDALRLADETPDIMAPTRDWRAFAEAGVGHSVRRDGTRATTRRFSLDLQIDHLLSPELRLLLADRIDGSWPANLGQPGGEPTVNTLKEAYLSWRAAPATLFDAGRINVRNGVANGYNPTDYFRAGAVRSVVSLNPASLRENRQGSVMLRGQQLWQDGSLTALYSPGLSRESDPEGFHLDFGATNRRDRALLAISQKVGAGLTPQLLVYREASRSTQFGLNLAALLGDATVANLEWSGGRAPTQWAQGLSALPGITADSAWRNRLAAGLTHTTPDKLTVTAEWHYNGAAPDAADWGGLRQQPPPLYAAYRAWAATEQESATRRALFLHVQWQDVFTPRLDLALMHNRDLVDGSRRTWLEIRYRIDRLEYAWQGQRAAGAATTNYGAVAEAYGWQMVLRCYF